MISKEKFLNHIAFDVLPLMKQKEWERKKILKSGFALILADIAVTALVLWNINGMLDGNIWDKEYKHLLQLILTISALILLFVITRFSNYHDKIKNLYKEKIIGYLDLKKSGDYKTEHLSLSQLANVNFFKKFHTTVSEDAFFSKNEPFFMAHELKLIKHMGKSQNTFFHGPVIYYRGTKPFAAPVILIHKNFFFTERIKKSKTVNWEPVSLEDTTFNKKYRIYSDNQIRARLVLTPAFMERLKAIKNTYNASFKILFFENNCVIAINTQKDMFEFYDILHRPSLKKFAKFHDGIKVTTDLLEILEFK